MIVNVDKDIVNAFDQICDLVGDLRSQIANLKANNDGLMGEIDALKDNIVELEDEKYS